MCVVEGLVCIVEGVLCVVDGLLCVLEGQMRVGAVSFIVVGGFLWFLYEQLCVLIRE